MATAAAGAAVVVAGALGLLHLAWAAGSGWGVAGAIPTTAEGVPMFTPGRLATVAVAGLLLAFAGLTATVATTEEPWFVSGPLAVGVAVLGIRAIGDRRHVGFTKKVRSTTFGRRDERWYTPLVTLLAMAASAAFLT
jgi:hypothetical protein